jgi:hypothetical protein
VAGEWRGGCMEWGGRDVGQSSKKDEGWFAPGLRLGMADAAMDGVNEGVALAARLTR